MICGFRVLSTVISSRLLPPSFPRDHYGQLRIGSPIASFGPILSNSYLVFFPSICKICPLGNSLSLLSNRQHICIWCFCVSILCMYPLNVWWINRWFLLNRSVTSIYEKYCDWVLIWLLAPPTTPRPSLALSRLSVHEWIREGNGLAHSVAATSVYWTQGYSAIARGTCAQAHPPTTSKCYSVALAHRCPLQWAKV